MVSVTAGRGGKPRHPAKPRSLSDKDVFLDVVVLISVLLFVILAAGVGLLAIEQSLH